MAHWGSPSSGSSGPSQSVDDIPTDALEEHCRALKYNIENPQYGDDREALAYELHTAKARLDAAHHRDKKRLPRPYIGDMAAPSPYIFQQQHTSGPSYMDMSRDRADDGVNGGMVRNLNGMNGIHSGGGVGMNGGGGMNGGRKRQRELEGSDSQPRFYDNRSPRPRYTPSPIPSAMGYEELVVGHADPSRLRYLDR